MKTLDQWLSEYAESHQNKSNKMIHRVCVPLIMLSLLGLVSFIPLPEIFTSNSLDLSHLIVVLALVFYATLSMAITGLMIGLVVPMLGILWFVKLNLSLSSGLTLWGVIFVLAWIGQFIGHKIEGKKPSFFQDLAFLLIGPLWVVAPLFSKYRKI